MNDPLASLPLSAIRVFEAAARLGSFTQAARELGMTQAAVSWQVKALEDRLGQPLFRRQARAVVLTPAGERLSRAASDAMAGLRSALSDIRETGEGVLTITTLLTFATQWLAPRLGAFQVEHPGIAVRLDTDSRIVDLLRDDADVGIRGGRTGEWPGLEAAYLFPSAQTALVSDAAMARLGPDPSPRDLLDAPRVGSDLEWRQWFAAAGVEPPPPSAAAPARIAADNQVIEVATALANGAIAIGSPVMYGADLAAGRLHQPFEVYIASEGAYWLAYPQDRRRARKIAAFRAWLLDHVRADPAAQRLTRTLRPGGPSSPATGPA